MPTFRSASVAALRGYARHLGRNHQRVGAPSTQLGVLLSAQMGVASAASVTRGSGDQKGSRSRVPEARLTRWRRVQRRGAIGRLCRRLGSAQLARRRWLCGVSAGRWHAIAGACRGVLVLALARRRRVRSGRQRLCLLHAGAHRLNPPWRLGGADPGQRVLAMGRARPPGRSALERRLQSRRRGRRPARGRGGRVSSGRGRRGS
jgi:hypothetical protein